MQNREVELKACILCTPNLISHKGGALWPCMFVHHETMNLYNVMLSKIHFHG